MSPGVPGESGGWLVCAESDLSRDALGPAHALVQDPDVLDTWFSSALWPHSTLGWPEATPELAKFYPTSVLSTARDIITLWVARMVIFGLFNRQEVPFRDVYIHPVIQDGLGRRMSKSLGNGVDPVDIIEIYGADALRYTLAAGATETQDLRIPVEKLKLPDGRTINTSERFEQGRNFANKFWNAARFALMNLEGYEPGPISRESLPIEDRWILDGLDRTIAAVTSNLEQFQFAEAARQLARLHLGGLLRLVPRVRQGPAPRPGGPSDRPAGAGGGLGCALPALAPDHAVRHRTGLAGLERPGARARISRAEGRRGERLHRGLASSAGMGRLAGAADRRPVVRGDQGDPQLEGRAERPQGGPDRADHRRARGCRRGAQTRRAVLAQSLVGRVGDDRRLMRIGRPTAPSRSCPMRRSSCRWRA